MAATIAAERLRRPYRLRREKSKDGWYVCEEELVYKGSAQPLTAFHEGGAPPPTTPP
jgi:hypothetical protein